LTLRCNSAGLRLWQSAARSLERYPRAGPRAGHAPGSVVRAQEFSKLEQTT